MSEEGGAAVEAHSDLTNGANLNNDPVNINGVALSPESNNDDSNEAIENGRETPNSTTAQNGESTPNGLGEALESIDGSVNADSVCATIVVQRAVCALAMGLSLPRRQRLTALTPTATLQHKPQAQVHPKLVRRERERQRTPNLGHLSESSALLLGGFRRS